MNNKIPDTFVVEIKEYLGLMPPSEDNSKYINKELKKNEKEDLMIKSQLENMKEMAAAPFGPNSGITREQYVRRVTILEQQLEKQKEEVKKLQ